MRARRQTPRLAMLDSFTMTAVTDVPPLSSRSLSTTLLVRLRDHDPDAWRRLTHVFGPLAFQWCRRAGLSPADAADVTQDIFRSVSTGLPKFRRDRPGDTFRGWLASIARSRIRDFYRRTNGRPEGQGGTAFHQLVQNEPDPLDDASRAELEGAANHDDSDRRGIVRRALELVQTEFEPATWTAFWRTTVDGAPPAEVAAALGVSLNAIYKAKSRVLGRLRQELDGLIE
jgi:RNA polymerase sigma-70 factor (ECF subfamily)